MAKLLASVVMGILAGTAAAVAQEPTPAKPPPTPTSQPRELRLRCSDTVLEAMSKAAEQYRKVRPEVSVTVAGGGSAAALAALAEGKAEIAILTRQASPQEFASVRDKGFEPMQVVIGYHRYVIVVAKDNPLESVTMGQLASVWRAQATITKWSQLGVAFPGGRDTPVQLVGPTANSASSEFLRTVVVGRKDEVRGDIAEANGGKAIVERVAKDPTAMGFCPAEYAVGDAVRIVPIAATEKGKPAMPTVEGGYPLQRAIYLYFRDEAGGDAKAFSKWLPVAEALATLK